MTKKPNSPGANNSTSVSVRKEKFDAEFRTKGRESYPEILDKKAFQGHSGRNMTLLLGSLKMVLYSSVGNGVGNVILKLL